MRITSRRQPAGSHGGPGYWQLQCRRDHYERGRENHAKWTVDSEHTIPIRPGGVKASWAGPGPGGPYVFRAAPGPRGAAPAVPRNRFPLALWPQTVPSVGVIRGESRPSDSSDELAIHRQ